MNTPKFTAEASLYNQNLHYQATTDPGVGGGVVQPASPFSSATYSNRPVPVFLFSLLNTTLGRFFVKPPGALLVISGVIQCSAFGIRPQPPARGPSNPFTPFRVALRWSTRF